MGIKYHYFYYYSGKNRVLQHPEPDLYPEKEKPHTDWCAACWQREKDQSPLRGLWNPHLRCIK